MDQEETDTRTVMYCAYAQEQGYGTCICRSDSDVLLLHRASKFEITIFFLTGRGRMLLKISDLAKYGQDMCTSLIYLHSFNHCDSTR